MKRWVYVSMSLLAGMATGTVQAGPKAARPAQPQSRARKPAMTAAEVSKCLKRLNLDKAPAFADNRPCMSASKG